MAKITGKILYIYPTQQITLKNGNTFNKRDFVIAVQSFNRDTGEPTIDESNTPLLSLTNDRCALLDNIKTGQIVSVDFYLCGRRYRDDNNKEKIITDINVTSVRPIGGTSIAAHPLAPEPLPTSVQATPAKQAASTAPQNDDLPF